ncbi:DUF7130 family rubredoxin-like protein [Halorarius litoreus]|uniref:DUF7130 family rubredoxin-like protein n=1 Tax=Halorarius litoreus TaxID=2962676 RepID=UPI0020CC58A5|nr:hypothetical protein [Halorarius litoreus]
MEPADHPVRVELDEPDRRTLVFGDVETTVRIPDASVHPHAPSGEEVPGQSFGEGYLMWRCGECGEMGDLEDGFPETCPNCDAPKEELLYWIED